MVRNKINKPSPRKIPDIRITDEVLKRMVADEQHRIGDPNVTKTAGRIIERYFAARQCQPEPIKALDRKQAQPT